MKIRNLVQYGFMASVVLSSLSYLSAAQVTSLRKAFNNDSGTSFLQLLNNKSTSISFKVLKSEKSRQGTSYAKLQQMYKGLPVLDHVAVTSYDKQGKLDRLHGYIAEAIESDVASVTPSVSQEAALSTAKATHLKIAKQIVKFEYSNFENNLVIFVDDAKKAHLAYVVMFNVDSELGGQPARPRIIVDANSNQVLSYVNALTYNKAAATGNGGNEKIGQYFYGQQMPNLEVTANGSNCSMKTENVTTIDLKGQGNGQGNDTNLPTDPFSFTCSDHQEKTVNGAYSQINDAHFFGTGVFNMYKEWFGINPLKTALTLRVHYGQNFENAFWDGKQMTFGDGKDMFYPLAVMDVTAHEVSHGFTEFNSNLTYANQSGGINEAFSDIAGEAMEYYSRGKNDFLVGAEIGKSIEALRYFQDPTKDKKSIAHVKDFAWSDDTICQMCPLFGGCPTMCTDVHHSSGIFNKAFYLIATANGWDVKKAFEIFVRANQKYWTAGTTFADGAAGVMDAAKDLSYDTAAIKSAFSTVGIEL